MHSRYWGAKITSNAELEWVQPYLPWSRMGSTIPAALEMLGSSVPATVRAMTVQDIIADTWVRYLNTFARSPQTLLHGGPHIGNTYVLPDGEVGFLDWQVVRRGDWSLDLGYLAGRVDHRRSTP
jgi:aminoglycoside phosphotransferase (APT) family kinase protein